MFWLLASDWLLVILLTHDSLMLWSLCFLISRDYLSSFGFSLSWCVTPWFFSLHMLQCIHKVFRPPSLLKLYVQIKDMFFFFFSHQSTLSIPSWQHKTRILGAVSFFRSSLRWTHKASTWQMVRHWWGYEYFVYIKQLLRSSSPDIFNFSLAQLFLWELLIRFRCARFEGDTKFKNITFSLMNWSHCVHSLWMRVTDTKYISKLSTYSLYLNIHVFKYSSVWFSVSEWVRLGNRLSCLTSFTDRTFFFDATWQPFEEKKQKTQQDLAALTLLTVNKSRKGDGCCMHCVSLVFPPIHI